MVKNKRDLLLAFQFSWLIGFILVFAFKEPPPPQTIETEVVVEKNTVVVVPRVMQINLPRVSYTEEDIYFLTEALYFESRGESMDCQAQVGYTIINRVRNRGGSVKDTIWAYKQFSYTHDGKSEIMKNENARQVAQSVAILVLNGYAKDRTEGGEYFFNPSIVNWAYKDDYKFVMKCDRHNFHK